MGSCEAFNGTCGSRIHHRTGPVLHSSSEFELPCSFGYSTMKCKEDISKIERCDKFDKCRKTPFLSGTGSLGDGLTKPKNATFTPEILPTLVRNRKIGRHYNTPLFFGFRTSLSTCLSDDRFGQAIDEASCP